MKLNWNFQRDGVLEKIPSVEEAWIFSGTTHSVFLFQIDEILDAAEKLKGIGNEQFKSQNYKVAEKKYTKTLR